MINLIKSNNSVVRALKRQDVQDFIKSVLADIENNSLRDFIKYGHEKYFNGVMQDLMKSFTVLKSDTADARWADTRVHCVMRDLDGRVFSCGDSVFLPALQSPLKIGTMYTTNSGADLSIRLDFENGSMTWTTIEKI